MMNSKCFFVAILLFVSNFSNAKCEFDGKNDSAKLLLLTETDINYLPLTDLPIHIKSNRIINFQSSAVLPKGSLEVSIQHRFGALNTGIDNLWGIDNLSSMRLGIDYGITNNLTAGIGRSSLNKTYNVYGKYRLIGNSISPFTLTYLADMMVDGREENTWGLKPFFFSHRINYVHTLLASFKVKDFLFIGISPTLVHKNLVELSTDDNDIYVVSAYVRAKVIPKVYLTLEGSKIIETSVNVPQNVKPSFGLGVEYYTPKHVFQLSFSNTRSLNEAYIMAVDQPVMDFSQFCLGFNIVRRW